MRKDAGMTLPELLMILALAALLLVATAAYSVPWLARESMRSAAYEVQRAIQTARIQAVSRNHECRFAINTTSRLLRVVDTMGTAAIGDDQILDEVRLPETISFARPDVGLPVTMAPLGGSWFGARFNSEGTVLQGWGEIVMFGGDRFGRISLFAAGGVQADRWSGSSWLRGL